MITTCSAITTGTIESQRLDRLSRSAAASSAVRPLCSPQAHAVTPAGQSVTACACGEQRGLTALLAAADRESRSRRWLSIVPVVMALQVVIIAAYPRTPAAGATYVSTLFS